MVEVPSTSNAASKYSRRGSAASQDYEQGVQNSSDNEWQEGASAADDNWADGVRSAINNNSFSRGVANPDASWQSRSLELGTQRFSSGVQAAEGKYEQAVQPFFQTLESVSLPPRQERGSPANYDRSEQVGQALHEARTSR